MELVIDMKKITLNKYQKIGLLISLLWIVIVFFNVRNSQMEDAKFQGDYSFRVCKESQALNENKDLSICEIERTKSLILFSQGINWNAAASALAPLPFLWLAAFILFHLGRGIKIGYKAVVPWHLFSLRKKIYAGLCLGILALTGYAGLIAYFNAVADSRVPVGLGHGIEPSSLPIWKGNQVYFSGTWTRHGLSEGSSIAYPINLSNFVCNRDQMECIEAQSEVLGDHGDSGHTLSSHVVTHLLNKWTENEITYKEENLCATEDYTIDLKSGAVSGIGHLTNIGKPGCMPEGQLDDEAAKRWPDKTWTMTLTYDGFSVYWAERKKAFPQLAKILMPWVF